jgi:hypothetical protein
MALLNKLGSRIGYPSRTPSPLPEKIAVLLEESRWLLLIVVASFLALSLWGYHQADPGWSHAVTPRPCTTRPGAAAPGWPT